MIWSFRWTALAALAVLSAAFGTLPAAAQVATITSPQIYCGGDPWYDARCDGAVGDGVTDDTAALDISFATAAANGWNYRLPRKRFKITSTLKLVLDPAVNTKIISDDAIIDGSTFSSGATLGLVCGPPLTNSQCFYFRLEGRLYVQSAAAANPAVQIGYSDFSDIFVNASFDFIEAINSGAGGACNVNRVINSTFRLVCSSETNGYGLYLSAATNNVFLNSQLSSPGIALRLSAAANVANVFLAPAISGGGTCLVIDSNSSLNVFVAANFSLPSCAVAINATAGAANTLVGVNHPASLGPSLTGIFAIDDMATGAFASVPAATGLPQIQVGGAGTTLGVSSIDLAPVAAPSAPTSGWRLYTDTGDGKWKAKSSGNIVRTYGNP